MNVWPLRSPQSRRPKTRQDLCENVARVGNSQKEARSGLSNSEKLTWFKIAADILITIAGEFLTAEIEDTESL